MGVIDNCPMWSDGQRATHIVMSTLWCTCVPTALALRLSWNQGYAYSPNTWLLHYKVTFNPMSLMNIQLKSSVIQLLWIIANNHLCSVQWWELLLFKFRQEYWVLLSSLEVYYYNFLPKSPASVFLRYPFWDFTWLGTDCIEPVLTKYFRESGTWLYPKFECNGAYIADATTSPVYGAFHEP